MDVAEDRQEPEQPSTRYPPKRRHKSPSFAKEERETGGRNSARAAASVVAAYVSAKGAAYARQAGVLPRIIRNNKRKGRSSMQVVRRVSVRRVSEYASAV